MIIDEADRMLDMGFEKEMNECLQLIKKRCPDKFTQEPDLFHSSSIKINFVSATISPKVASLGAKLMKEYDQVGFGQTEPDEDEDATIMSSIPKQVQQFWMEVPAQYRLLYLLMFLYAHQHLKVIVFASNCETVNFLYRIMTELDWRNCINKRGREETKVIDFEAKPDPSENKRLLFEGKVYKLHGDMDHSERKTNFSQFDKNDKSLLVCTDVASRGLDFKGVEWIV
jgi:ATP-dependent RNA helicase DDX31/DBP7